MAPVDGTGKGVRMRTYSGARFVTGRGEGAGRAPKPLPPGTWHAKYVGTCAACRAPITKGQVMTANAGGRPVHHACKTWRQPAPPTAKHATDGIEPPPSRLAVHRTATRSRNQRIATLQADLEAKIADGTIVPGTNRRRYG